MHTFDGATNGQLLHPGQSLGGRYKVHDAFPTRDGDRTVDSTGAYLVGELERLDQTLNLPMVETSWQRDVDLREDITIADDYTSFTNTTVASQGGLGTGNGIGTGKAWMGRDSTQIAGVSVSTSKTPNPLNVWALEVKYSIIELASSAKIGRPIDAQKIEAMELKRMMDIDEQVYIGDISLNIGGLYNSAAITNVTNFPIGVQGQTQWVTKTPDEILLDVNSAMTSVWAATGYSRKPNKILLPPLQFAYISLAKVSVNGGLMSIKKYIEENNFMTANDGKKLVIESVKWGQGAGAGGTYLTPGTVDRMIVYIQDYKYVRFPLTLQARTPIQYEGMWHKWYYYHKMGGIEIPYPNTIGLFDGL